MAIDKSRTTIGVKVMLIVLALVMVGYLGSGVLGVFDLFKSTGSSSNTSSADVLGQISQKYTGTVAAFNTALASDPASYTVLVNMGNTYFDWGMDVAQAASTNQSLTGSDQPMFLSARQYYERALKIKQEPAVSVDLAISYFYSGDATQAIATAEATTKTQADFAPAWFNLGIFYSATGNNAAAIGAFEKAVALDPDGKSTNVAYAKQSLATLKGSSTATTSP